jgi:hypothetical protein
LDSTTVSTRTAIGDKASADSAISAF